MNLRTCVHPEGRFIVGRHAPGFEVKNLRENDFLESLGCLEDGTVVDNRVNFPAGDVYEPGADLIYEIANPFPFRGATFINPAWADPKAGRPETIGLGKPTACSLLKTLEQWHPALFGTDKIKFLESLPRPLALALAQASTDPDELTAMACLCCTIQFDPESNAPVGLGYKKHPNGHGVPDIRDHEVFEILVNNPHLPDPYKNAMVLKPGVQGKSEIIGEYLSEDKATHVFEYLRRNSYIPWGHFAANMANDAIRYRAADLSRQDITGLRHLYYQRIYVRVGRELGLPLPQERKGLPPQALEDLRTALVEAIQKNPATPLGFNASLWGWNYGFGAAQSGHRLHASHQMIHQQNAMIPARIPDTTGQTDYPCFAVGDLVADFITAYEKAHGVNFFDAYIKAIQTNERTDQRPACSASLIVHEDENVILFAPKAQVSEWELQLMAKTPCAHILEADTTMRQSLDTAIFMAIQALEGLGATLVTSIELSGRLDRFNSGQHLVYAFIPRLPYAPGTFSEAQLRFISGCFPEDFAHACREKLTTISRAGSVPAQSEGP